MSLEESPAIIEVSEHTPLSAWDALRAFPYGMQALLSQNHVVFAQWVLEETAFKAAWISDGVGDFGMDIEKLLDNTRPLEGYIIPEDIALFSSAVTALSVKSGEQFTVQYRINRPQGESICIRDTRVCIDARSRMYAGILADISELRRLEAEVQRYQGQYDSLVNNISEYIYTVYYRSGKAVATFHNPYCEKITGWTNLDFTTNRDLWYDMIFPEDREHVLASLRQIEQNHQPFSIEHRIIHRDGSIRWINNSCVALLDAHGSLMQLNGFIIDLTRRHVEEEQLSILADTDSLTGALNRRAGLAQLKKHLKNVATESIPFSLCFIDVDNLKQINDELGHSEGDALLKTVVAAIHLGVRKNDAVSRFGGDEFIVLLSGCDYNQALEIGRNIDRHLEALSSAPPKKYTASVSKGIIQVDPQAMPTPEDLIKTADGIMYIEKQRKKTGIKATATG